MPLGHVRALDENRRDLARCVSDRLVDEIHKACLWGAAGSPLKDDLHILADERLSSREQLIEETEKALTL